MYLFFTRISITRIRVIILNYPQYDRVLYFIFNI
nr:MAG TPA: hypothetical protein [Caudoviricetes sp.]